MLVSFMNPLYLVYLPRLHTILNWFNHTWLERPDFGELIWGRRRRMLTASITDAMLKYGRCMLSEN